MYTNSGAIGAPRNVHAQVYLHNKKQIECDNTLTQVVTHNYYGYMRMRDLPLWTYTVYLLLA